MSTSNAEFLSFIIREFERDGTPLVVLNLQDRVEEQVKNVLEEDSSETTRDAL